MEFPPRSATSRRLGVILSVAVWALVLGAPGMQAGENAENGEVIEGLSARQAEYARYALAQRGDAKAGEKLFRTHEVLKCTNCHNVTGMEKAGPNLDGVGDKYSRGELIRQVLKPSESLKPGFEQVTLVLRSGELVSGRVERANRVIYRIIDAEGKQRDIDAAKVLTARVSGVSMMPEDLVVALELSEFGDLVAYLETLRFGIKRGLVAGGKPIDIPRIETPVQFEPIHAPEFRFENPVWCGALPSTERDLVVVEQHTARVWRLVRGTGSVRRELFVDLGKETYISGNQGLMCLAFHPRYRENRRYFLEHEVKEEGKVKTTVVERRASREGLRDSGESSRRLLEVVQPAYNHNGGCIAFGPDGMLYAGFGDGGPQRDPPGHSQNPRIFLGSMLRIDVDRRDTGRPYGIPSDNPFIAASERDPAVRAETWAIGLREPWRFSFDPRTGDLWVGDVGQDRFEEVCHVRRGENHGWNVREGFAPFSDEYRRPGERYADPLFAYEHGLGFSVTGGHVYRGKRSPSFEGVYVFGDYNTRRVWGLRQEAGAVAAVVEIGTAPGSVVSFGLDQEGEIYLVTYAGTIWHVDLSRATFPTRRSRIR